ncbi:hypothetical protein NDN11_16090 [Acinetobacter sp. C26M]|uniref:hypothetical protein n=1 Tax=unclassified Acinetobacter TaxID=196816 RepID=UPI002036A8CB|nr:MULTISPECIES: hypothetical protein [unclassified Acinetobacter]USA46196.1 hypothetical protein NDN11_16090 [Acinetobacter sp. C26M]USA49680.1 hypothetical protein NDN12_16005 [Acinetobacter sp. C26G]
MNIEPTLETQNNEIIKPFQLNNLFRLFFQPKKFFSQSTVYHHRSIIFAAYLIGIVAVMDRVDQKLLSAETRGIRPLIDWITASWLSYWLWVLGIGIISAAIAWLVQGWWYKKRLQFSGAKEADPQLARHVYVLQSLVFVLPIVITTVIQTFLYPNYLEAYNYSTFLGFIPVPFLFLSCWVSYRGATQVFPTNGWAKFWFLGLPILFYILIIGAFTALIS